MLFTASRGLGMCYTFAWAVHVSDVLSEVTVNVPPYLAELL